MAKIEITAVVKVIADVPDDILIEQFNAAGYPQEPQPAPKQEGSADELEEVLRERDNAEDFIDELLDEVLGADRPEWSSAYNRYDAMNDVRERITALHKPAVDKAWGRFESATTEPKPAPAVQGDALYAAKHCLEMGESFRALRRVVNLLLEARRNLGPEDHELRDRIDRLLRDDAARAAQEGANHG